MSLKLLGQVSDLLLPRSEKEVCRGLCDSADDIPGQIGVGINCYPSIDFLAWKSDYKERQVQRALRKLETLGVAIPIAVHPTYGTTEYEIHLERAPKKIPFQPKKRRGPGRDLSQLKKGVTMTSRVPSDTPHGVYVESPKGDILAPAGVSSTTKKGVTMTPNPLKTYPEEKKALFSSLATINNAEEAGYVERVLKTFGELPGAAPRADVSIPRRWFADKVPVETVEHALWIGAARHVFGSNFNRTVSLSYFKPVVTEILNTPVSPRYVEFIKFRMPDYVRLRAEGFGQEVVQ